MNDTDEPRFKALLLALGSAFRHEVTAMLAKVYWRALRDLDYAVIDQAAERHLKTSKFFPTVAELRSGDEATGSLNAALDFDKVAGMGAYNPSVGTVFPRAEKVAQQVSEAAARAYVIAGGPRAFERAARDDDMTWVRKEFLAGYREAIQQGVPALPAATVALLPAVNQQLGLQALPEAS